MYKKARRSSVILYTCGTLAIGMCIALIVFIVWILVLRTQYKETCLEINDHVAASSAGENFVIRDGKTYPLSAEALDYYNQILLQKRTLVYNRKEAEANDKSIVLKLSDCTLTFTGLEHADSINVKWETPEGVKHYSVRSADFTFPTISSYMKNYLRRTEPLTEE